MTALKDTRANRYSQLFSLDGKTALVTGGATGIGRMCAEALLTAGARVMIVSRKGEACAAAAHEMSAIGPCEGFGGNLESEDGVEAVAAEVRKRADRLDILVNNAGATWGAPLEEFPWSGWDKVLTLNVVGLFDLTRRLAPMLAETAKHEDPARIVNIGSVTGLQPYQDNAFSYGASKAAVHHLTKVLSNELAARRITVNAIAPGPFLTKMTAFALEDPKDPSHSDVGVPLGRLGNPDDMAATILYLCGRGGSYVNGAILPLDGGMSAGSPANWFDRETS